MKALQLKKLLENVPDDTPILIPSIDHSYYEAHCRIETALYDKKMGWTEFYENPDKKWGVSLKAIIIGE